MRIGPRCDTMTAKSMAAPPPETDTMPAQSSQSPQSPAAAPGRFTQARDRAANSLCAGFEHLRRSEFRLSKLALARDCLIFLTLVLTALALDAPLANASLWTPLALGLAAISLMIADPAGPSLRIRPLILIAALVAMLAVRALLLRGGPLPTEALAETRRLATLAMSALVLWMLARQDARRAGWLWIAAMALGWINTLLVTRTGVSSAVAIPPAGAIAGLALALGAAHWFERRWDGFSHPKGTRLPFWLYRTPWIAAGTAVFAVALLWTGPERAARAAQVYDAAGSVQFSQLPWLIWMQSMALGWGPGVYDRLSAMLAEPALWRPVAWGGPGYTLASMGLAGASSMLILALWILARGAGAVPGPHGRLAGPRGLFETRCMALAALWSFGLMLGGGPRSGLFLFAVVTLAAAAVARGAGRSGPPPRRHWVYGFWVTAGSATLTVLMAIPTWGGHMAAKGSGRKNPVDKIYDLQRAERWLPRDPSIQLALASAWRARMTATPRWDQSYFDAVTEHYRRAVECDPYDPAPALQWIDFLDRCEHGAEAVEVAQATLGRQPNSDYWHRWLALRAMRNESTTLAGQTIAAGLRLRPDDPGWWDMRYRLAHRLGQGPVAGQALAIALTARPSAPETVAEDWRWREAAGDELLPSIELDALGATP